MRVSFLATLAVGLLCACNPSTNNKTQKADSAKKNAASDTMKMHTAQPDVVEADEHSITDKIDLQVNHLLGKEVNCRYAEIPEHLKLQLPSIMQAISNNRAVITGSYHIILLENPSASSPTRIFIGIPIQKPFKTAGFSIFSIPAGSYLRHQCAAEPGKSLALHQKILNKTFENLKEKAGLPVIEKYTEVRNDEMTSVLSKATFYYRLP